MSDFEHLTPGSVILEWSPSGELKRWVVQKPVYMHPINSTPRPGWKPVLIGYDLLQLMKDETLRVGGMFISKEKIDASEGFGYSYTYLLGEVYALPEILKR